MLISLVLCIIFLPVVFTNFFFIILSQETQYDAEWADVLEKSIIFQTIADEKLKENESSYEEIKNSLFIRFNGSETLCYWNYLCLIDRLIENDLLRDKQWFVFLDSYSDVRIANLKKFFDETDPAIPSYYGYGLYDKKMTIIHHYYGTKPRFHYPDNSAGFVMTRPLLQKLYDLLSERKVPMPNFTIDPNHELARFIFDNLQIRMTSKKELFCLKDNPNTCGVSYVEPLYKCSNFEQITADDIKVYVKTWSGNHETRLPVILNTWGSEFKYIDYISDKESQNPPTKSLGVPNTKKGHCAKTFAILENFVKEDRSNFKWLLIADDDTLLNVNALIQMLNCHNSSKTMIIGERYGYGASISGKYAYNYPTGGAGMIFSRKAADHLSSSCNCPNVDSPDDMVIGMCSLARKIPIIHSPAFHQAQPSDYSDPYLEKIWPISFHKFTDIDPILLYKSHVNIPSHPKRENYREPRERLFATFFSHNEL